MQLSHTRVNTFLVAFVTTVCLVAVADQCRAQSVPPLRGVYAPGFNATNAGVMPEPGVTYINSFIDYSFDELKCARCGALAPEFNGAVFVDINALLFVSKTKILGGNYAVLAALPISNSAISLVGLGPIAGGGGLADSFYQPVTLGWHLKRADLMAAYAVFIPTGRFTAGASDNTGTGHWTNAPTGAETIYLTKNKATAISAYQMYEFHTTQNTTNIHPGQTFDLDYSLTQMLPLEKNEHTLLQLGVIGYGMWQTTDNSGPRIDPALPAHYRVNAIGGTANILLPARKASFGLKLLHEFSNASTVEGYSLQITSVITF